MVKTKLKGIEYNNQNRIDHCGGAAACIALAFLNMYKNGKMEEKVTMNKYITNLIRKRLCTGKSEAINEQRKNITEVWKFECACKRRSMKKNQYQLHKRACGIKLK